MAGISQVEFMDRLREKGIAWAEYDFINSYIVRELNIRISLVTAFELHIYLEHSNYTRYSDHSAVRKFITVKGIDFYYDNKTFEITDEVLYVLENFPHEEDETAFYIFLN